MKILLLGKNGQVGWELQRALAPLGEVVALDFDSPGPLTADFSRPESLAATVRAVAPQIIVNSAAHTAVDKCESEPELARAINALAPGVLAREAKALGAWLLHYSTDYVFDGSGATPWLEDAPTGAELLADVSALALRHALQRPEVAGTYHAVAAGETNWFDYARFVIEAARVQGQPIRVAPEAIEPVPTSAFVTPARRPANSRLNTRKLRETFGLTLPAWQSGVERMLAETLPPNRATP